MAGTRAGLAGLALAAAFPVLGCGHCIEDRVAAVYDHTVVTAALDKSHQIAFLAIAGRLPTAREARRILAQALALSTGVDPRSLRVSMDSASLSIAYDAKRVSSEQLVDTLNRKLEARGLSVSVLKVMERGIVSVAMGNAGRDQQPMLGVAGVALEIFDPLASR